jgi:DNA polymerase-3 subunit epsilon
VKTSREVEKANFVAFDTELTGLDYKRDSIISIGAIKLEGASILPGKTFYRLLKPEAALKREGILVHELTHSDLDQADGAKEVLEEFVSFVGDAVLIGHFVFIDTRFVGRAMKRHFGLNLQSSAVDTLAMHDWLSENDAGFAQHFGGISLKNDLASLAARYGVRIAGVHNAFRDAYMTAQLFQRFLPFLTANGVITVKDLLAIGRS